MTTKDNKKKSSNVTIVDVADMCGVSVKTVSRVVNQDSNVSERTRKKVLDAIKETGYQVNMFARGLKGQKTNIIMIFTDRHGEEHLSNWHTLMLKYLFRYAKESGMKVVMSPSNSTRCIDDDTDGFTLLANGMAGNPVIDKEDSPEYAEFKKALNYVNTELAKKIAGDGEGATCLFEVKVIGAESKEQAVTLSQSVVMSTLTKAAIYGHDANWGRILCAMGYSGAQFDPEKVDLYFESKAGKLKIIENGVSTGYSEDEATKILSEDYVTAIADVKMGTATATAWGCDLTHEYVNINADYRS